MLSNLKLEDAVKFWTGLAAVLYKSDVSITSILIAYDPKWFTTVVSSSSSVLAKGLCTVFDSKLLLPPK